MSATEANGWTIFDQPVRGRTCGSCKACCTAIPVDLPEGKKPANVRCRHLKSRGCGVYNHRPVACQYWSCRWLFDATTADLRRPDHSGYIIDPVTDVVVTDGRPVEVLQIWVHPDKRHAHRDPALRAWLEETHRRFGYIAMVRWGSAEGVLLVPPAASDTREWLELGEQTTLLTKEAMDAKLEQLGVTRAF